MWLNDGHMFINENNFEHEFLYKVLRGGSGPTDKNLSINRDNQYFFSVIHCISAGEGTLNMDGNTYQIKKGCIFVIPPYKKHSYTANKNNPFSANWIEIAGLESGNITTNLTNLATPIFISEAHNEINEKICCVLDSLKGEYNKYFLSNLVNEILTCFVMIINQTRIQTNFANSKSIEYVLSYIDSNYSKKLTSEELANLLNYSTSHFIKIFEKTMNLAPSKYIENVRINKSKQYLCMTKYNINQIAELIGLYDANHFIKRFKAIVGMTPSAFRKEHNTIL